MNNRQFDNWLRRKLGRGQAGAPTPQPWEQLERKLAAAGNLKGLPDQRVRALLVALILVLSLLKGSEQLDEFKALAEAAQHEVIQVTLGEVVHPIHQPALAEEKPDTFASNEANLPAQAAVLIVEETPDASSYLVHTNQVANAKVKHQPLKSKTRYKALSTSILSAEHEQVVLASSEMKGLPLSGKFSLSQYTEKLPLQQEAMALVRPGSSFSANVGNFSASLIQTAFSSDNTSGQLTTTIAELAGEAALSDRIGIGTKLTYTHRKYKLEKEGQLSISYMLAGNSFYQFYVGADATAVAWNNRWDDSPNFLNGIIGHQESSSPATTTKSAIALGGGASLVMSNFFMSFQAINANEPRMG